MASIDFSCNGLQVRLESIQNISGFIVFWRDSDDITAFKKAMLSLVKAVDHILECNESTTEEKKLAWLVCKALSQPNTQQYLQTHGLSRLAKHARNLNVPAFSRDFYNERRGSGRTNRRLTN